MVCIDYSDLFKVFDCICEIFDKNCNVNIFCMMVYLLSYFEQYCWFGGVIRYKGEFDLIVCEFVIMCIGILCEVFYEIIVYKWIGKNVGVMDVQNEVLENWQFVICFDEV